MYTYTYTYVYTYMYTHTHTRTHTQAGGKCRLAAQPETSLYRGSTLVHAGQLPIIGSSRAQALKVPVRGLGFVPVDAPSGGGVCVCVCACVCVCVCDTGSRSG